MKRAELVLFTITAMWGFTFPAMKVSLDYLPPILFLAYRFGIASLIMLLPFRSKVLKRETLREGFLLGERVKAEDVPSLATALTGLYLISEASSKLGYGDLLPWTGILYTAVFGTVVAFTLQLTSFPP